MTPLSDEEFRLFREWLADGYGLCFGEERRDILRSRLEPLRSELRFGSFRELYYHLNFDSAGSGVQERLLPFLTNNESYFCRERPQLELLGSEILPALRDRLRAAGEKELRVLSAACAAGEEAYTLAIVVRESGFFPPPWRVSITGGDLDADALGRACRGTYGANAFRGVEPDFRARFFREQTSGVWEIDERVRRIVAFRPLNLVDADWSTTLPPQHVIFCRNVLIYFDDRAVARAVEQLHRALVPGGYLFLGHADSLNRVTTPFVAERRPGVIYYRRMDD